MSRTQASERLSPCDEKTILTLFHSPIRLVGVGASQGKERRLSVFVSSAAIHAWKDDPSSSLVKDTLIFDGISHTGQDHNPQRDVESPKDAYARDYGELSDC